MFILLINKIMIYFIIVILPINGEEIKKYLQNTVNSAILFLLFAKENVMSAQTQDFNLSPASLWRRGVAFLLDCIIAVFPALVMLFVFTGSVWHNSVLLTPFPTTGAVVLALDLPSEVHHALNTDDGIYLFQDHSASDDNLITVPHEEYNVSLFASGCRMLSVLCVLFFAGYTTLCTVVFDGKTIGKKLMHIKVVPKEPVEKLWKPLLIRELCGKMLLNSLVVPVVISIVMVCVTREHLSLQDVLGGTRVVEE
jgi:uncharacterized RDD family membrane protein YckC